MAVWKIQRKIILKHLLFTPNSMCEHQFASLHPINCPSGWVSTSVRSRLWAEDSKVGAEGAVSSLSWDIQPPPPALSTARKSWGLVGSWALLDRNSNLLSRLLLVNTFPLSPQWRSDWQVAVETEKSTSLLEVRPQGQLLHPQFVTLCQSLTIQLGRNHGENQCQARP